MLQQVIKLLTLFAVIGFSANSLALTKEQQSDSYMLEAQKAYKQNNFKDAVRAFEKIEELNVSPPDEIHYYYAHALSKTNQLERSWKQINTYLNKTGRSGVFYTKALDLRQTLLEERRQNARSYVSKIDTEKESWSQFMKDYSVTHTLTNWLAEQKTKATDLLNNDDFQGARRIADKALNESKKYKDKTKDRYPLFSQYKKDYAVVNKANNKNLISTDFSTIKEQHDSVVKAYQELSYDDFDLYIQIASKRVSKESPIAQQALDKAERIAKEKARQEALEKERRRKAEALAREEQRARDKAKKELERVSYFPNLSRYFRFMTREDNPAVTTTIAFLWPVFSLIHGSQDILSSEPTKAFKKAEKLRREIAARPSSWGNKDSMLNKYLALNNAQN